MLIRRIRINPRSGLPVKGQPLVGVPQLVPGEALLAVGGLAAEDRREGALGPVLGVVAVLARALDARDEVLGLLVVVLVVLALVGVNDRRLGVAPPAYALDPRAARAALAGHRRKCPLRAADRLRDVRAHAVDLDRRVVREHLVRVLVDQVEVVVDLPDLLAHQPPARAVGLDRVRPEHPVDDVDVVDVLLDDVVPREPLEEVPVAHLVVHVEPLYSSRFARRSFHKSPWSQAECAMTIVPSAPWSISSLHLR